MHPDIVLRIADTEKWLLQPELKAIKDGLAFGVKEGIDENGYKWSYRGYLNTKGEFQGVGIKTYEDGY